MRTVKINFDKIPMNKQTMLAIGYLSGWASQLYDKVLIYATRLDEDHLSLPDLIANYEKTGTNQRYTIGAVGDAKTNTYSFHS